MPAGKENLMEHIGAGKIGDEHTESNRHQQQRLKFLHDTKIQQNTGNADHNKAAPVTVLRKEIESRIL